MKVKDAIATATEDLLVFLNENMEELEEELDDDWEVASLMNHPDTHVSEIVVRVPSLR